MLVPVVLPAILGHRGWEWGCISAREGAKLNRSRNKESDPRMAIL